MSPRKRLRQATERAINLYLTLRNPRSVRVPLAGQTFHIRSWREQRWWIRQAQRHLWEPVGLELLSATLKPGDVFFDVGAWIGPYSLLASRLVGETGHVYAFEPAPETRSQLQQNLQENATQNVTVIPLALSDHSDGAVLTVGMTTSRSRLDASATGVHVETTTLAEACRTLAVAPDVVKMDVEGSEASVLQGAEDVLVHARSVFLEFHTPQLEENGHDPAAVFRSLFDLGKRVIFIEGKEPGTPESRTELVPDRLPPGTFSVLLTPK